MPDPFHVRFNVDVSIEEAQRRFINRIETKIRQIVEAPYGDSDRRVAVLRFLLAETQMALGEPHREYVTLSFEFMQSWQVLLKHDFSRCLLAVEGFAKGLRTKSEHLANKLDLDLVELLRLSEVDLGITWHNGFFSKKGAELLDDKLVNESLRWLADAKYQNVLAPFQKGLSHLLEGTKDAARYGDAVTDMYEALEAMAKITTGKPTKDLSALRDEFVSNLKLQDSHKRILKEYIEYGCDFRHALETSQRRTWPLEHEAENFVYMTGLFIRLAIQAEKPLS